jgi:hypothetical protein
VRFIEYFQMLRADFAWLSDELRDTLEQDLLRRGAPLSLEARVAVGLYPGFIAASMCGDQPYRRLEEGAGYNRTGLASRPNQSQYSVLPGMLIQPVRAVSSSCKACMRNP